MKKIPKYAMYDKGGAFYLNNLMVDIYWHDHFAGLSFDQERRCVALFISWFRRRFPDEFKKVKPYTTPNATRSTAKKEKPLNVIGDKSRPKE